MRCFIWSFVPRMTSHYHDDAGVMVIAADIEAARAAVHREAESATDSIGVTVQWQADDVELRSEYLARDPDHAFGVGAGVAPVVVVFPDAGCC